MNTETVNLLSNTTVVGTASIQVPNQRFPNDLGWLAPVITVQDGPTVRYFKYQEGFAFGVQPISTYVEFKPIAVPGVLVKGSP